MYDLCDPSIKDDLRSWMPRAYVSSELSLLPLGVNPGFCLFRFEPEFCWFHIFFCLSGLASQLNPFSIQVTL